MKIINAIADFLRAYQEAKYEYFKKTGHRHWY